jgi:hypothetical protein
LVNVVVGVGVKVFVNVGVLVGVNVGIGKIQVFPIHGDPKFKVTLSKLITLLPQ